jgi:hypothetical protein
MEVEKPRAWPERHIIMTGRIDIRNSTLLHETIRENGPV